MVNKRSSPWLPLFQERCVALVVWLAVGLVTTLFLWLVSEIVLQGIGVVSWEFILSAPQNAGRDGGIGPMLVATALIVGVCLGVSVPLGLGTAIVLAEYTNENRRLSQWVRRSLDVLAGVPSIVFGLFGHAFFCLFLGLGFSLLSGGMTLACMVLPLLIRSTEESLRAIPREYRLSAAALGLSRWTTVTRLLIPLALPGFAAGLILGVGRAMAETAALLFTSGYVDRFPTSLLDSGRALSVHIWDLAMNVPGGNSHAYASALVLVGLLFAINLTSSFIADQWKKHALT
ncbi:MAG: phosphate ABC transporter permease PstA [Nitrospirae bacterium]|nr:MAG: phosphate ABC transporter permease PstA [Nitrospirota bacterium]